MRAAEHMVTGRPFVMGRTDIRYDPARMRRGSTIVPSLARLAGVLPAAGFIIMTTGCIATPKRYTCYRAGEPLVIDGRLDEAAWRAAPVTDRFVDIEGDAKPRPRFETRARLLWDDEHLYIGAELEEPHVWATLRERDSIVFHDNDFEVFIDPDGDSCNYYEIEINAFNTIFDLLLVRTYRAGGPARHDWNLAGLRTAVHVDGTLNDPRDIDRGWSVEMALPWAALAEYANRPSPPRDGDIWRMNFSRVQWQHRVVAGRYEKVPETREDNWVWSPQGVIDMHIPDRWGFVEFSAKPVRRACIAK